MSDFLVILLFFASYLTVCAILDSITYKYQYYKLTNCVCGQKLYLHFDMPVSIVDNTKQFKTNFPNICPLECRNINYTHSNCDYCQTIKNHSNNSNFTKSLNSNIVICLNKTDYTGSVGPTNFNQIVEEVKSN